jgi:hypothetical protein
MRGHLSEDRTAALFDPAHFLRYEDEVYNRLFGSA